MYIFIFVHAAFQQPLMLSRKFCNSPNENIENFKLHVTMWDQLTQYFAAQPVSIIRIFCNSRDEKNLQL